MIITSDVRAQCGVCCFYSRAFNDLQNQIVFGSDFMAFCFLVILISYIIHMAFLHDPLENFSCDAVSNKDPWQSVTCYKDEMIFVFNPISKWCEIVFRLERMGSCMATISLLNFPLKMLKFNLLTLSPDFYFLLSRGEHSLWYNLDAVVTVQPLLLFFLYQIEDFLKELYFSMHPFPKPTTFFKEATHTFVFGSVPLKL